MVVLGFGIEDAADLPRCVQFGHGLVEVRVGGVLPHHVDAPGFLHRLAQCHPLRHGGVGRNLAQDMEAGPEGPDSQRGVGIEVGGDDHGVHVLRQEFSLVRQAQNPVGQVQSLQATFA